jgi:hypothetical protein
MSDLRIDNITNRTGTTGPVIAGVSTVTSTGTFVVPVGPTEMRGGRGRGVFVGGILGGSRTARMNYIEIATAGNSEEFGNLTQTASQGAALGSSIRGIAGGGSPSSPSGTTNIDYFIFSSDGGANEFGDFLEAGFEKSGASNNTRGLFFGSSVAPAGKNYIEYVTIATTGTATDFGYLSDTSSQSGTCASPTRALICGGNAVDQPSFYGHPRFTAVSYVTISTTGNAQDFGQLDQGGACAMGNGQCGSSTRGILLEGAPGPAAANTISYISISSLGNSVNFGDRSVAKNQIASMSSDTRAVFGGAGAADTNLIDYVTISTTGNSVDFGDLPVANWGYIAGCSDVHGGLG